MVKSRVFRFLPFVILIGALFLSGNIHSQDAAEPGFQNKNFAGARVGFWSNTGDKKTIPSSDFSMEFSNSSIYGEFFYAHRISPLLALELTIGIYSRGDIRYLRSADTYIGAVNIYPIFVAAKVYPLKSLDGLPFLFYLQPGVGFVYGNQNVINYDIYYDYGYDVSDSRLKFTYSLGAGIDIPVASQIALTSNFRYVPVKFGKPLAEVQDYSGWTLTIGAGYIFQSRK